MKYKVLFTKIKNNHDRLRTNTVEGVTQELPTLDNMFVMFGKSLTEGMAARVINTSPVKKIEMIDNIYMLTTESGSEYSVKVLEEIGDENAKKSML